VTSPPYWRFRDYGHGGELGHELDHGLFDEKPVEVLGEVKHGLKPTGTLWLNLGDT
jgi:hypothetical protein